MVLSCFSVYSTVSIPHYRIPPLQNTIKVLQEAGSSTYLLAEMSQDLKEILGQWFTPQLLEVCPITWQSPCDLLEKVSSYEAVHPLRHWKDLKHRLGANRRCFAFMHGAIPNEPIVILHAALTKEPSSCIHVSVYISNYPAIPVCILYII